MGRKRHFAVMIFSVEPVQMPPTGLPTLSRELDLGLTEAKATRPRDETSRTELNYLL